MRSADLAGRRILVLGLGLHGGGGAVAAWLARHGARVTVSDIKSRAVLAPTIKKLKGLPIKFVLGKHPQSLLKDCDLIMQNPGVPADLPLLKKARQLGIDIENEASLFLKLCPSKKIIGVTGSKGKSTTTALVGAMLHKLDSKTIVAGNIKDNLMFGVLDKIKPNTPVVLELSSWHLEVMGAHKLNLPLVVVTNVYPEHLNRYRSMSVYAQAKAQIFLHQTLRQKVVLNHDNIISKKISRAAGGEVCWFSLSHKVPQGIYIQGGDIRWSSGKINTLLFKKKDVRLRGEHNLANVLAATAVARLFGVPLEKIRQTVKTFSGFHDRLELISKCRGVEFYNDTTATAPVATQAALNTFKKRHIILIAGGADKNLEYTGLAKDIKKQVKTLVLLPGTATAKIQRALKNWPHVLLAPNMRQAVNLAFKCAAPGSVVLLSPGAASFGLFKHEFDRGEQFKRAVDQLCRQ